MSEKAVIPLCRTTNKDALFHHLGNAPEQLWETEWHRIATESPSVGRLVESMVLGWTMEMKATLASGLSMLTHLPSRDILNCSSVSDEDANAEARFMRSCVAINFTFLLNHLLDSLADVRRVNLAFGRLHRIIRLNE